MNAKVQVVIAVQQNGIPIFCQFCQVLGILPEHTIEHQTAEVPYLEQRATNLLRAFG